ncbi:MAG: AmmeMemoRadiSam system radical SAM enzyme [Thermodesulfovibrionales bacterium]|nr:AmmeMemoRadiSam system radical SAM enzyme [Thermodesulfovibrionales bacterium]
MKEAMLYEKLPDGKVKCFLCSHRCTIMPGKRGICAVRENIDGALMSLVYGRVIAMHIDPIEKKPLFHFLPGSTSYSIATVGCNFRCGHCQNYEISQFPRERPDAGIPGEEMTPEGIAEGALRGGCRSISYTYTEPTIFFEFCHDCAMIARGRGIKNVFVSNGFMTPESARLAAGFLDGNNIDLKGDAGFYKNVCRARVEPVKETIRIMKESGVWVEVTTLIIPGLNDSEEVLKSIAGFLVSLDPSIPWHVTQFYPTYKMLDRPRTPVETLRRARDIGFEAGLKYVYEGNVPGEGGENTYCPSCKEAVIKRFGFSIIENRIKNGSCPKCGAAIEGRWA